MSKVTFPSVVVGVSGKLGRVVYRQQFGKTVVAALPKRKPDKPTAAQRKSRERFQAAHAYAKSVLADPLKREVYRRLAAARNRPPNALLIANFLNAPTIDTVDTAQFRGAAGDVIRALASDSIEVMSVTVTAYDIAGRVLESGAATRDHDVWEYRCTTALGGRATKFELTAVNRSGAKGVERVAVSGNLRPES